jgi:hypothetical protein
MDKLRFYVELENCITPHRPSDGHCFFYIYAHSEERARDIIEADIICVDQTD